MHKYTEEGGREMSVLRIVQREFPSSTCVIMRGEQRITSLLDLPVLLMRAVYSLNLFVT